MEIHKYPLLYQINTRVYLTGLSKILGRKATLDDIPDAELDRLVDLGIDWVWLLSVWQTGKLARNISRENPELMKDFKSTLPDVKDEDIEGSGFAIAGYMVNDNLGGDAALKRFHKRLKKCGLKLMLDFVPNHMGPDHPWVQKRTRYFIQGTERDLENSPQIFTKVKLWKGDAILAYGRDPNYAGWSDTIQLDFSNPATVAAMTKELTRIAKMCDGVRCDMAMLMLPEVFEKTWGRRALSFWREAIQQVREKNREFCFMAEVYWDMEWNMHQQGFDYAYDKRLYDSLVEGNARSVREHFLAGLDFQGKLARFLENHDEPRAASSFGLEKHKAAAILTFFSPGLRFFHQGQFEGRRRHTSPHLVRALEEPIDEDIRQFYQKLLSILKKPLFRDGQWHLLECVPANEENESHHDIVSFSWYYSKENMAIIVVNFSDHGSQCYVHLPILEIEGQTIRFNDLMSETTYEHHHSELMEKGLYIDMPAWGYHIFKVGK
jgi:hypothetical protein